MGLNSDKTSKVFVLIFAVFLPDFISFVPKWHSHLSFMKIVDVLISTPHKTRTFTVRLAVTTKYQGNGFAAQVLLGRDHPRVVPIGPIVRGVIAFIILGTWWDATTKVASQSVHLQAFDLMTVIAVLTCCCIPIIIKIGSRLRPPDAHDCIMFNSNGRRHGNRIIADMSGTWWDVTTQVASQSVHW